MGKVYAREVCVWLFLTSIIVMSWWGKTMKYKVFSIQDANMLIPTLKPLLVELAEKKTSMSKMHDALLTMELLRKK